MHETCESPIRDFVRHLKGTNRALNTQTIYRRAAQGLVAFLVLITPAFLKRIQNGGVSEKELSELLAPDLLIPVAHGVTYDEIRSISPLLGSRNGSALTSTR